MKFLGLLLGIFLLAGCTTFVPGSERVSWYVSSDGKMWSVHVVDIFTLQTKCGPGTYGCVYGKGRFGNIYVTDSWGSAKHECNHVDSLASGSTPTAEWIKDILYGHLTGLALSVIPIPAGEDPCGESYMFDGEKGRLPNV